MSNKMQHIQKIEEKFKPVLSNEMLTNALSFVEHLLEIGMTPLNDEEGNIRFGYKCQLTCIIIYWKDCWFVCDAPANDCDGFLVDDDLKKFAWAHVKTCNVFEGNPCGCGNEPGKSFTVFGKDFENVCTSELQFFDPDAIMVENMKKLMNLWAHKIDNINDYCSQTR